MSYGDYTSNLMPGVSLRMLDEAAGVSPEDDGLWWDDEAGCWQDSEAEYCRYCGLMVPLDSESGLCAECVAELAALTAAQAGKEQTV